MMFAMVFLTTLKLRVAMEPVRPVSLMPAVLPMPALTPEMIVELLTATQVIVKGPRLFVTGTQLKIGPVLSAKPVLARPVEVASITLLITRIQTAPHNVPVALAGLV